MFDPADFLTVARELADAGTRAGSRPTPASAYLRTAFSRAYYALYLRVRAEISLRHGIDQRRLLHGALYTHLQNSRANARVRELGRELQRLYDLRRKADYDVDPDARVAALLADTRLLRSLIDRAEGFAAQLSQLDFAPVVSLFRG